MPIAMKKLGRRGGPAGQDKTVPLPGSNKKKKPAKATRRGGMMKSKGMKRGGKMKAKGMAKGGKKGGAMTLASIRSAAKAKGYKLVKV